MIAPGKVLDGVAPAAVMPLTIAFAKARSAGTSFLVHPGICTGASAKKP